MTLAIIFAVLSVIMSILGGGIWLVGEYHEARAIRAKNGTHQTNCARLEKNADLEHQALLDGNLLQGLYGAFPPADEFRPPPEECGPVKVKSERLGKVQPGQVATIPSCNTCGRLLPGGGNCCETCHQQFTKPRTAHANDVCDICGTLTFTHTERQLRACQTERGKPTTTVTEVWKCHNCRRRWRLPADSRCPACQAEDDKIVTLRPRCKSCKRFVRRGVVFCDPCWDSGRRKADRPLTSATPTLFAAVQQIGNELSLHSATQDTWAALYDAVRYQVESCGAIPGPPINIPTHYDKIAKAVVPDIPRTQYHITEYGHSEPREVL